jgi:hypothetical protein
MYCTRCGAPNEQSARFCIRCGAQMSRPLQTPAPDRRMNRGSTRTKLPIFWIVLASLGGVAVLGVVVLLVLGLVREPEPTATVATDSMSTAVIVGKTPAGGEFQITLPTPEPKGDAFVLYETDSYIHSVACGGNIVLFQSPMCGCIMGLDRSTGTVLEVAGYGEARSKRFAISGKYAVWEGSYDQPGVHARNLASGEELPIVAPNGEQPALSGSTVVWTEKRQDGWDILGKDLETNQVFAVVVEPGDQTAPAISGSVVVWKDDSGISGIDLSSGDQFIITAQSTAHSPAISDNFVVWFDDCGLRPLVTS